MEKNKTAQYLKYAIGEILLVVIGILIALSINNWNVSRINKNLEEQYIIRLLGDLKEEKAIMEATFNYSSQVHSHAKKAMMIFEYPEIINEDPVKNLVDLYQASQIQQPTSAESTYRELIASGQISFFQNNSIKTSLIRYYEYNWTKGLELYLPNEYRGTLRRKMPYAIQDEIRTKCGDIYIKIRETYEAALPKECEINIPTNIAQPIVELLKQDATLKGDLRVLIGNVEAKLEFINSLKKQLAELINELESSIK